ncbi:hypothetical protein QIS99_31225 [Streptomyces sp. B-S-A8]|uniref:Secreted protein n=1 Tax=Streptomyces solicavernae TaxID=3043614 RepID=A0ABT6S1T2_9ACTN|nr:hypothetical protein [Streptomyces sp. B-S-A8]MDI3390634.1 hypothetical protein [Streptomyces sp. B-S-A8]
MSSKKIVPATALALALTVFGWSAMMTAMGHAAVIASLAPVLGLTVQQVVSTVRSRTTPASGHRVATVPDQEDSAP